MGLIRVLLALSVLLVHTTSKVSFVSGQLAVQSFYIISGFYMSLILNEKYINKNNSYKLFITNRFLRIYPIYWVVLILVLLVYLVNYMISNDVTGCLGFYVRYFKYMDISSFCFLVITNLFIFFQDNVMFLGLNANNGSLYFTNNFANTEPALHSFLFIPQAWTVGIELLFYVIAPFLVRRNIKLIIMLILILVLGRVVLFSNGFNYDPWTHRFFPAELVFFLFGNISYRIYDQVKYKSINKYILNICFASIICFTLSYSFIEFKEKYYIYIILFFILLPFVFHYTKKWKMDSQIGELSYPIYISHVFIIMITEKAFNILKLNSTYSVFVILAVTICFSFLLNELIAKRVEKFRQGRLSKKAYSS